MIRRLAVLLMLAIATSTVSLAAARSPKKNDVTFDEAISNMAKAISSYLKDNSETSIKIEAFSGPSSAGRSIQQALENKLIADGFEVKPFGPKWTLRGDFSLDDENSSKSFLVVLIKAILVDSRNGREISEFRDRVHDARITSAEDITTILGIPVELKDVKEKRAEQILTSSQESSSNSNGASRAAKAKSVQEGNEAIVERIKSAVENPKVIHADAGQTEIKASDDSPFRVQLLVKKKGTAVFNPVQIDDVGGQAVISGLQAGDVYKIHVSNDASHDIGVKVSIDGINSFALAKNASFREMGAWRVGAKSSGNIDGWFVDSNSETPLLEFLLTGEREVPGLPPSNGIGTITVQFFHAWGPDEPTPSVELVASTKDDLRTRPGLPISRTVKTLPTIFGKQLLTSISLRYSFPTDLPPEANLR